MIPELKGQEKNTLYIIGNGFDLYHGLRTSYNNFFEWLKSNHYYDFVSNMEQMFPQMSGNKPLLWKDFEEALGKFDLLDIHRKFFQGKDDRFYDEETYMQVVRRISPILKEIPILLRRWLKDIDVFGVSNKLTMSWDSLYLSFNYTMLLEHFYSIPEKQVFHIHNHLKGSNPLITGHNIDVSTYEAERRCWGANEEKSVQLIAEEMKKLRKPVYNLTKQHQWFFNSLNEISNVVVFGHSLSLIDRLYITKIQRNIQDYSHWYFISKDDASIIKYQDYVVQYNNRKSFQRTSFGGSEDELYKKMMIENCQYIKIGK